MIDAIDDGKWFQLSSMRIALQGREKMLENGPLPLKFGTSAVAVSFAVLVALFSGCGKTGPEMAPVEGVVRVNGQPRSGLLIRFLPDPSPGKQTSISGAGITDDEGHYALQYIVKGKEGIGAAVGPNRVLIEDTKRGSGTRSSPAIPPTYSSPAATPLSKEVKPGDNKIDLDIKL